MPETQGNTTWLIQSVHLQHLLYYVKRYGIIYHWMVFIMSIIRCMQEYRPMYIPIYTVLIWGLSNVNKPFIWLTYVCIELYVWRFTILLVHLIISKGKHIKSLAILTLIWYKYFYFMGKFLKENIFFYCPQENKRVFFLYFFL